jgi:hypothetical protein
MDRSVSKHICPCKCQEADDLRAKLAAAESGRLFLDVGWKEASRLLKQVSAERDDLRDQGGILPLNYAGEKGGER